MFRSRAGVVLSCVAVLCALALVSLLLAQSDSRSSGSKTESVDPATIRALIAQLADSSFEKRQEADKRLASIGAPALELLRKVAKESPDPELRNRATRLIQHISGPLVIRVGILHSLTGIVAIEEKQLRDAELLAIDEINKAGGVLGKQVEPISEDPQSRFTDFFPLMARKLLVDDKVAAIFGCYVSVSRKNVLPVVEQNDGLLFYPAAYEGNECSKNVLYTGALPNQQVLPAVDWLVQKGYRKFYLLGSNYIYPRTVNLIVRKQLEAKGLPAPIAEKYTELGGRNYEAIVKDICKAQSDVIISSLFGDSNLSFFNELAAQGIKPGDVNSPGSKKDCIPVLALSVSEDELRDLRPDVVRGHLAARTYFQSLRRASNQDFVKKFRDRYGRDRVVNDMGAAAYAQIYLWKLAVEKAKSTATDDVRKALHGGITFDAPEGKIRIDPKTQHLTKYFRLGRIREDRQFDILYESPTAIEPDPYPQVAFPGRQCDWTK